MQLVNRFLNPMLWIHWRIEGFVLWLILWIDHLATSTSEINAFDCFIHFNYLFHILFPSRSIFRALMLQIEETKENYLKLNTVKNQMDILEIAWKPKFHIHCEIIGQNKVCTHLKRSSSHYLKPNYSKLFFNPIKWITNPIQSFELFHGKQKKIWKLLGHKKNESIVPKIFPLNQLKSRLVFPNPNRIFRYVVVVNVIFTFLSRLKHKQTNKQKNTLKMLECCERIIFSIGFQHIGDVKLRRKEKKRNKRNKT